MDIPRIAKPARNSQGIGQEALICELDWLTTIAEPAGPFTNYGDDSIIGGNHVFATGKGFRKVYISNRSSKLMAKYMGGQDSRAVKPQLEAFMPVIDPVTTTFFSENKRYLVLVPDITCSSTRYIQIGTSCRGAEIPPDSVEMSSGVAESNEEAGHKFIIDGFQDRIYFYEGTVTLYP
ncbi:MAG: hypothetical protein JNL05_12905 [Flavobacteriales bacterium]|nr:hypothetical protein [Flavobacteriales bacterium]